jgi:hypothetical protein
MTISPVQRRWGSRAKLSSCAGNVAGVTPCFCALASAELYDPAAGTFTITGGLSTEREEHTATLLGNGEVLIAGGSNNTGTLASAELYDPAAGTFTA